KLRIVEQRGLADPGRSGHEHAGRSRSRDRGLFRLALEQSQGSSPGGRGVKIWLMTSYSVVVALHIIAVVAAFGLPLSAPLIVPYVRRHHPDALPGLHAAQHFVNNAVTGPFTILLLAFGIYLATDGDRWGDP